MKTILSIFFFLIFIAFISCGTLRTSFKIKNQKKYSNIFEDNYWVEVRTYQEYAGTTVGLDIGICYHHINRTVYKDSNYEKIELWKCKEIKDTISMLKFNDISCMFLNCNENGVLVDSIKLEKIIPEFGGTYYTCLDFLNTLEKMNRLKLHISYEKDSLGIITKHQKEYMLIKHIYKTYDGNGPCTSFFH